MYDVRIDPFAFQLCACSADIINLLFNSSIQTIVTLIFNYLKRNLWAM